MADRAVQGVPESSGKERGMTVKDFKEFCCVRDIVLKDAYNGRVYTKIENYLDKQVTGFYPRFDLMRSNDSYNPISRLWHGSIMTLKGT